MIDLRQLVDSYSRQARLYPAILTFLPTALVVIAWFPSLTIASVVGSILTVSAATGLAFLLSDTVRSRGRRLEPTLLKDWGGWPTTQWLRHNDNHLDLNTKRRYHSFLTGMHTKLRLPTREQELADPGAADAIYESAVAWLREQCRGKEFSLVDKENASYGFRRNLLGVKPVGLALSASAAAGSLVALSVVAFATGDGELIDHLRRTWVGNGSAIVGATVFAAASVCGWIVVVRANWVREAGHQYARALLACCDTLSAK